eukprot:CAMPEP_0115853566 /NCGR_PEP_ID=MMETSP0287-20121206/13571_1 /TAXON_ID=412157 /ORGANISM="Chrysochromulina rotalis, Strain UIO044" /LENGTH=200 /DNA_ID=CAMNT_0003307649 /DNA_START=494 /DNA_END=1098 /DNA_ORIENTATION=-
MCAVCVRSVSSPRQSRSHRMGVVARMASQPDNAAWYPYGFAFSLEEHLSPSTVGTRMGPVPPPALPCGHRRIRRGTSASRNRIEAKPLWVIWAAVRALAEAAFKALVAPAPNDAIGRMLTCELVLRKTMPPWSAAVVVIPYQVLVRHVIIESTTPALHAASEDQKISIRAPMAGVTGAGGPGVGRVGPGGKVLRKAGFIG